MKRKQFSEEQIIGTERPHSSLGYATPAAFAAELERQRAGLTPPAASPALMRDNAGRSLVAAGRKAGVRSDPLMVSSIHNDPQDVETPSCGTANLVVPATFLSYR